MQPDRPLSKPTSVENKLANVSDAGIRVLRNNSLDELLQTDCSQTERNMPAVLIVDDDHAFRTLLHTLFEENSGFDHCVEAASASEALDKSKQLSPSLAIVNFSMPEMNGLQLARELKAREPALPIFMLTAEYDVDIEKQAFAFGITAVFSKLDDLTTLIANARVVCGLE
jgi:CheY-like chemotaxis protein